MFLVILQEIDKQMQAALWPLHKITEITLEKNKSIRTSKMAEE